MSLTVADFKPGRWELIDQGSFVVDRVTGRKFKNVPLSQVQLQACGALTYGIVWNSILTSLCITARTIKTVSCYHLWKDNDNQSSSDYALMEDQKKEPPLTWKQRFKDAGVDGSKLVAGPFLCIAQNCLLCITVIQPSRNHKKYVNAFDRLQFDDRCLVVPFFKPEAELVPAPPEVVMK